MAPESFEFPPWGLPSKDIAEGLKAAADDLGTLAGSRILVTGGTGFLGGWLTASLLAANSELDLGLHLTLLTRSPATVPLRPSESLTLLEGDVRRLPPVGPVDVIVHGAASSSALWGTDEADPIRMADTIVSGTRGILDVATASNARVLFLSSGAVYGPQQAAVSEDVDTGPDPMDPRSAYGNAKRLAENMCAAASAAGTVQAVIARLFAFVGPRIPLDVHFAAGNFLRNALEDEEIVIQGDGLDVRSYLYAGDLPEWCWALLARGEPGRAYNVGSPVAVTIKELADTVAAVVEATPGVRVAGSPATSHSYYVPHTDRALKELGLRPRTDLVESLKKTFDWLAARRASD